MNPSVSLLRGAVVLAVLACVTGGSAAVRYTCTDLAALGIDSPGALNNSGHVAGVSAAGHLLLWDGTAVHDLGTFGDANLVVTDLNDRDEIVGYVSPSSPPSDRNGRAFLHANGQFVDLAALLPAGASAARAISSAGVVVGDVNHATTPASQLLFRYEAGRITTSTEYPPRLEDYGGRRVMLYAANERGQCVGTESFSAFEYLHTIGFQSAGGEVTVFEPFDARGTGRMMETPSTMAFDLNEAGTVVGVASDVIDDRFVYRPFRTMGGTMLPIGLDVFPLLLAERPIRINNRGTVALSGVTSEGQQMVLRGPVLIDGGVVVRLQDVTEPGYGLNAWAPIDLNDRGQILCGAVLLTPTAVRSRLVNVSARAAAGTGSGVCINGFVLASGDGAPLLIRTVGPALVPMGVSTAAVNPSFRLLDRHGVELARNDDWSGDDPAATAARLGAFGLPAGSRDAALLRSLAPGTYSVHAAAEDPARVVLAEIYHAGTPDDAQLVNASIRLAVGTGDALGVLGFVVAGGSPCTVLIRAVGPSLASQGVSSVLPDPKLVLFRGELPIAANDDWGSASATPFLASTTRQVGAFPLPDDSRDAALVMQLEPGVYSAHVTGGGAGVALIELYLVP